MGYIPIHRRLNGSRLCKTLCHAFWRYSKGNRCRILLVSPESELDPQASEKERNWLPLIIATVVVLVVAGLGFLLFGGGKKEQMPATSAVNAPLAGYASSLEISRLHMSESGNLAGGKLTYVDGWITNRGSQTVTGVTAQVIFRAFNHEVAQNENHQLKVIRMRDPYIDVASLADLPLKPGATAEFRLIFDAVSPNWDGAFPEIRLLKVESK